ncbi:MAG TPA: WcaF family extracellular polysaccharide biosynthesis acetyltransferase [Humisphaera sp.]|jgi:putative colanic acid biosynthesis acetyltransferase WcaF|nr:WcaF family extracellular polysaccharide biosynthesis acetyltransferase [Humisphaera sp.]
MSSVPDPPIFQRCDQTAPFPYRTSEYLRRAIWEIVQAMLFRFSPRRLPAWRRMLLRCFGAKISATANIRPTVKVFHPWLLSIGEWTALGDDVIVYNLGPVEIGAHSVVSHGAYLCAGTHDYTQPNLPLQRPLIKVGSGVWICAQAFIGPGVAIGNNSVVGARSVVMKDVPDAVVVAGNPARVIKAREMKPI